MHLQLGHLRISDEWDVGRPFFLFAFSISPFALQQWIGSFFYFKTKATVKRGKTQEKRSTY